MLPFYDDTGERIGELYYLSFNGLEPSLCDNTSSHPVIEAMHKTGVMEDKTNFKLYDDVIFSVIGATFKYDERPSMLEGMFDVADLAKFEDFQDFKEGLVRLARTPAEGASYFGVPNPVAAALQRQFNRIEDPTRLYPEAIISLHVRRYRSFRRKR